MDIIKKHKQILRPRGMHIRSSSDILLKWKDMRNLDILLNLNDIRSTSDMKELYDPILKRVIDYET